MFFSYANLVHDLRKQVFSATSVLRRPKHFVGLLHKMQRTLLLDFNTGTFCCLRDVRLARSFSSTSYLCATTSSQSRMAIASLSTCHSHTVGTRLVFSSTVLFCKVSSTSASLLKSDQLRARPRKSSLPVHACSSRPF